MSKRPVSIEVKTERRKAVMDTLKSMIFPTVLCAIIVAGVFVIINYQNVEKPEEIIPIHTYEEMTGDVVMENDNLLFTMDPATTQFSVLDKSSGQIWYSNPDGAAEDALALPEEKSNLQSTILMSYAVTSGLEVPYGSFDYSVKNGIYDIEADADHVKVMYSMGKVEKEYVIPPVTTKKQFEEWLSKMDPAEAEVCKQYYKKYSKKKLNESEKDTIPASYPIIEKKTIFVLRDSTKESVKAQIETAFEHAGYTYEDYLADKEYDNSAKTNDNPVFNISIEYKLDGDDLLVTLPMAEMEYKSMYPLYTVTPLPYFGAGGTSDTGYLFVPEGGGALINFNNGKTSQNSYYVNMYGWDMCITRDAVVHNTEAYYNVFGIARDKGSFICMMEDGRSYGGVQADISGKTNSFNYVNAKYSLNQREKYDVGDIANSDIYEYTASLPDEDIKLRYSFVDSTSYVDMAKDYSSYLMKDYGSYLAMNQETTTPVVVDIIGAVDKVKQVLGVPVSKPLRLTTYEEATEMINELQSEGMDNLSVKLSGWCNGGVKQKILKKAKPIHSLGSKKDLQNLVDTANSKGVDIYLNGSTQYERNSNIFDGFFSYRDAAKLLSKERAQLYEYSHVTFAQRDDLDPYYLLHTDLAIELADNLVNTANKYGAGVSYEDNGVDLSADYYRKNTHSRESVLKLQEEQFKATDDSGTKIMINMGNDYAAPYADIVTNMDLAGSQYTILDECVPFYQLALHGYVTYTGEPLNICGDEQEELLRSAEYGAGLQFTLMDETAFALQKTLYTQYYGAAYDSVHQRMVDIFTRYNKEMGHVFNQEMVDHKNLTETLSVTEYADGTKVYVNFGYDEATSDDGVVVPARDYKVVK